MAENPSLFFALIGCTPAGRHTEQHDVFAGIAPSLEALVPEMKAFWPEAQGKLHLDAWREVKQVDGYDVKLLAKGSKTAAALKQLWFVNLGGYQSGWFEELHCKLLLVASSKAEAVAKAKKSDFYQQMSIKGGASHIDDQWLVEADEVLPVTSLLSARAAAEWDLVLEPATQLREDELHIGYFKISKLGA
ncbi:MAG: DUF1543 domain-containing protein [Bacteroidia bacterium]